MKDQDIVTYVPKAIFGYVRSIVVFMVCAVALLGGVGGILAFVGYNGWPAFGVVALVGAIAYAMIEFHLKMQAQRDREARQQVQQENASDPW